jgi:hypothetical protein
MTDQAKEFVKIIAEHPEWMTDPEKRLMLAKMAKRIAKELNQK